MAGQRNSEVNRILAAGAKRSTSNAEGKCFPTHQQEVETRAMTVESTLFHYRGIESTLSAFHPFIYELIVLAAAYMHYGYPHTLSKHIVFVLYDFPLRFLPTDLHSCDLRSMPTGRHPQTRALHSCSNHWLANTSLEHPQTHV